MELSDAFAHFHDEIMLGSVPEGRIASAWGRLHPHIVTAAGVSARDVFLQGSYANGTAVRPPTKGGEYDLDIVAVVAPRDATPNEALQHLEEMLATDADLKVRIRPRKPCVRLEYAADHEGAFHIDVTPARTKLDHLEIPFRDKGWHETNPRGYTDWCLNRGERFARTVRMLKRWRDTNQDERRGIKSIVLQVLVGELLVDGSDASSIAGTLEAIDQHLAAYPAAPPPIWNPSLETENLSARWPATHYAAFRREVAQAADLACRALREPDAAASHRLWVELLGDDFPGPTIAPDRAAPLPPPPGYPARPPQQAPKRERYG